MVQHLTGFTVTDTQHFRWVFRVKHRVIGSREINRCRNRYIAFFPAEWGLEQAGNKTAEAVEKLTEVREDRLSQEKVFPEFVVLYTHDKGLGIQWQRI